MKLIKKVWLPLAAAALTAVAFAAVSVAQNDGSGQGEPKGRRSHRRPRRPADDVPAALRRGP